MYGNEKLFSAPNHVKNKTNNSNNNNNDDDDDDNMDVL